ncbi:ABC transporter permease [Brevibacillus agri]|uniref:ABC transporter permease n=1 Tax=Brevibacillus agri TaxID=51101 RepID=UPI0024BFEB83|nr:ABC transporter permease [Brevibacillus agri]MDR9506155.1 ABC transporter permease [Brevibacillus agri]MED3498915.1 ABC transporter permease [Brevibacillus agri]MED4572380.1 ABC transporter permease [Brevibacillus agri]WHX31174.1 ABC transporter permease [Brevibacillus agri]
MKQLASLLWAEMVKEHRHSFHSKMVYFSLLIWPAIMFVTAYYSFAPFRLGADSPLARFLSPEQLPLFLLTGYLGYIFFWCLVQSAWQMSFERQAGTMEMIFISPVNRLAFLYGRSLSSLVEGVWLFFCFTLLALLFVGGVHLSGWWAVPLAFVVLLGSAIVWGGFLSVLFLFSRDSSFLYTVLDEPMLIFSGVRLPPMAYPLWAKAISFCFPLTYALQLVRGLLMEGASLASLLPELALLVGVLLVLVMATVLLLKKAERHMKETGNMVMY